MSQYLKICILKNIPNDTLLFLKYYSIKISLIFSIYTSSHII